MKVFTFEGFLRSLTSEQLIDFVEKAIKESWSSPPKCIQGIALSGKKLYPFFTKWKEDVDWPTQLLELISLNNWVVNGNQNDMMMSMISLKVRDAYENHWLPNRQYLNSLSQLQQKAAVFFDADLKDNINAEDIIDDLEDDVLEENGDIDEDYLNEQYAFRASAFDDGHRGNCRSNKESKSKMLTQLESAISINKSRNESNLNKNIFCLSDFPPNCAISKSILTKVNLWSLSNIQKYTFIYSFLHSGYDDLIRDMNDIFEEIHIKQKQKEVIDLANKVKVLRTQKIVGATIIGASVQLSMIKKLAPKVVLVEEAAEVLESCLAAVLTTSVQKLILIGDHLQLKPQVDTYDLRREHNFHISMMERLIRIKFPYVQLRRQGRMRPEFSCMLKDIYPEYQDFPGLEVSNEKIVCLPNSMFFWSHQFKEDRERSVKNIREAYMVVALALFFIASGVDEADITILCAYLGQVQHVRKLYRQMSLHQKLDRTKQPVDIRTIDEYQGDENKYVIVSLTRSNQHRQIGFLNEIERRCVAQSRAKCGLYFVGDAKMFSKNQTWKRIMDTLERDRLISPTLPISCYRHSHSLAYVTQKDDITANVNEDKSQLMYYVKNNKNWCKAICNSTFSCGIEGHRCKKPCSPQHDDSKCHFMVDFTFKVCQHTTQKPCYENSKDIECKIKLKVRLNPCGHHKVVDCHDFIYKKNTIICSDTCLKYYDCPDRHKCSDVCGRTHKHSAENCPEQIKFTFPKCNHIAHITKACGKPIPNIKCKVMIRYKSDQCGHEQYRKCSEDEICKHACSKQRPDCGHPCTNICSRSCLELDCPVKVEFLIPKCNHTAHVKKECGKPIPTNIKCLFNLKYKSDRCGHEQNRKCSEIENCQQPCNRRRPDCGHPCTNICSRPCLELNCPVKVEFLIPKCNHTAHVKKECGKPIPNIKCLFTVQYKSGKCGHEQSRKCSEEENCLLMCNRERPDCGHPCASICSQSCIEDECKICVEEYQKSIIAAQKLAEEKFKACKMNEANPDYFKLLQLSTNEIDLNCVQEKCNVFFSLYSKSRVKDIVTVWKIQCPGNSSSFWERTSKAHGLVREELYKLSTGFLDTSSIASQDDIFAYLQKNPNSSYDFRKYASGRMTSQKGNEYTLLIAEVLLGNCMDHKKLPKGRKNKELIIQFLVDNKKDSIMAKNADHGPAMFSVYEESQIHLCFIVHITTEAVDGNKKRVTQDVWKNLPEGENLTKLSDIDLRDASNPLFDSIRMAISLYNGDCLKRDSFYAYSRSLPKEIDSVSLVVNHKLDQAYEDKVKELKNIKQKFTEVYAYHATKPEYVASIIKNNLDPGRAGKSWGTRYGEGCYFSEHPSFSFYYGQKTMFIFRLILIEGQFTSVEQDKKGFCRELVLQDASLFKPQFLLRF